GRAPAPFPARAETGPRPRAPHSRLMPEGCQEGQRAWPLTLVLAGLLALGGCASSQSPVLYPNAKLKQVGREQADRDIAECRKLAGDYVQSTAAKDVAKGTAVGGAARSEEHTSELQSRSDLVCR